jgi:hypothetical protein
MKYLDLFSLAATVDHVSEAIFFGHEIDFIEKQSVIDFMINRHYSSGAYAGMFAPTETDMKHDLILFTGERIKSYAGRRHVLGEEASRVLHKLGVNNESIKTVLNESDEGIWQRMNTKLSHEGCYCCKTCSCSLWLNVSAGGLNHDIKILKTGLEFLKHYREDNGRWKGFPYHYTLYVLNEIGPEFALEEMQFAARSIEKWIKRNPQAEDRTAQRRYTLGERILARI